jgi:hypothetical protein
VSTVAVTAAVVSKATPATNNFFFIRKHLIGYPGSDDGSGSSDHTHQEIVNIS